MKQKPILFSAPMVKAILEGRKSMTRRIIKSRHESGLLQVCRRKIDGQITSINSLDWDERNCEKDITCPYNIGDVLWVRESFRVNSWSPDDGELTFRFEADGELSESVIFEDEEVFNRYWEQSCHDLAKAGYEINPDENYSDYDYRALRLRPSIFMPSAAARIFLEVTDIKVERLQDISEEDAIKEGVKYNGEGYESNHKGSFASLMPSSRFETLWKSINGPESWDANPFVWAYTFKIINQPK